MNYKKTGDLTDGFETNKLAELCGLAEKNSYIMKGRPFYVIKRFNEKAPLLKW